MINILNHPLSTHHCHTVWSDGRNTVEEMVLQAISLGFKEIGISDHICLHPLHPPSRVYWSVKEEKIAAYAQEVRRVERLYAEQIAVKLGAEVDFFPDFAPYGVKISLADYGFDYLLGSCHWIHEHPVDATQEIWDSLPQEEVNRRHIAYWQKMLQLAECPTFHIMSHLDLVKKFGARVSADFEAEEWRHIELVLQAIKKNRKMMEINTSGLKVVCREQYPRHSIIKRAKELGIEIIVNDDAHSINDIGQFFKETHQLLSSL